MQGSLANDCMGLEDLLPDNGGDQELRVGGQDSRGLLSCR